MLVVSAGLGLVAPSTGAAHGRSAATGERALQRLEQAALGPRHAAEHARERRALRHARAAWRHRTPAERRRILARASAASRHEGTRAEGPRDQVGRWAPTAIEFPTYAINAVMLPTGRVLFWGRSPLDPGTQTRINDTPAYVWDPAKGTAGFTEVRPPRIDVSGRAVEAPLFCSGQSLLPSGEVLATGGTLAYPVFSGNTQVSDFKGLNRAFTFDPWALKWTEQPAMRKGRWYPTQAMLPDGRIAVVAGLDESGTPTDNPDLEVFTPSAVRGGRGAMTRYANAARPGTSYYPHVFTMPDGRLLMGGAEPGESALLDPARLAPTGASPWSDLPDLSAQYRYSASAVLLPAGPSGSSRVAMLGGLTLDGTGARRDTDVIDTRDAAPAWRRDDRAVPLLNTGRDYFNVVLLPDGSLASVGGAAGVSRSGGPPAPLNSYTGGSQELKHVELLRPGSPSWTVGPAQRKWRTYHSVALLLPDGRVLSAGDDYWDMNDQVDPFIREGATADKPLDEAEIYEPPYLFDGDQPAPRPTITGGPAAASWGDDVGVPVSESPGRPAGRAVLVAPGAVTHGVDMNQRHVELSVLGRVPGKGLNVRIPGSPNIAPPGWYMLFVLDSTGTPSVARWVQLRGGAPDAPTLAADQPAAPSPAAASPAASAAPVVTPAADRTAPRATVRARPLRRGARSARLLVRADEPARLTLRVRLGRRTARSRMTLTRSRLRRTLVLRLRPAERARLARRGRLTLRVTLTATDAAGNSRRRTVNVRLRVRRAATG